MRTYYEKWVMEVANYYYEIGKMIDKIIHKVLLYDKKGFEIRGKGEALSLLDIHILKNIGEGENKKIYELVEDMGMDRGLVASGIKKLMSNGYIIKSKSEKDKRVYILKLTEKGKEMYEESLMIKKQVLEFILKDVSLNEEKAILKFLSKMNQATLLYDKKEWNIENTNAWMNG